MTREEELYWRSQPEWKINLEMERRLKVYFESDSYKQSVKNREFLDRKKEKRKERDLDASITRLKKVI